MAYVKIEISSMLKSLSISRSSIKDHLIETCLFVEEGKTYSTPCKSTIVCSRDK